MLESMSQEHKIINHEKNEHEFFKLMGYNHWRGWGGERRIK